MGNGSLLCEFLDVFKVWKQSGSGRGLGFAIILYTFASNTLIKNT